MEIGADIKLWLQRMAIPVRCVVKLLLFCLPLSVSLCSGRYVNSTNENTSFTFHML